MPIKLPKGFQRRKSSGNALEELPNPPEPSFRVFKRPEGTKSFDGGNTFKRTSLGRPLSAGQSGDEHRVVGTRPDPASVNRGSGGTNNSASSGGHNDTSSSSARYSSTSTSPSSTDLPFDDQSSFNTEGPHTISAPPIPFPNSSPLKTAGRSFSFGRKKVGSPPSASQSRSRPVIEDGEYEGYSGVNRPRAMTESSYASGSTATPPKLLDAGLDLGQSDLDSFGSMFETFAKSQTPLVEEHTILAGARSESPENMPLTDSKASPKADTGIRSQNPSSPSHGYGFRAVQVSPRSLNGSGSQENLMANNTQRAAEALAYYNNSSSEPQPAQNLLKSRTTPLPDSSTPSPRKTQQRPPSIAGGGLRRSSVYASRKDVPRDSGLLQDEDARLVMESLSASQRLDQRSGALHRYKNSDEEPYNPATSLIPRSPYTSSDVSSGSRNTPDFDKRARSTDPLFDSSDQEFSVTPWQQASTETTPRAKKSGLVHQDERSLFDASPPALDRSAPAPLKPQVPSVPMKHNKIMTPAQFEKYRKEQETRRELYFNREEDSDEEADDYEDDDEVERAKQLARERRKQEAHLSVYRQQMMKVTGQQPSNLPNVPQLPGMVASISAPVIANRSDTPTFTFDKASDPGKASEEEDEDVPLGVLAAHGFPSKSRPPTATASTIQYKSESYPPPPVSVAGSAAGGGRSLPAFARKLPPDPYFGAGLVNPSNREPLALGQGGPPSSNGGSGSVYGGPQPNPHPGGLVGVIAGEERARAARRGSPNAQGTYGSPLPPSMGPMPWEMPPGMPPTISPGEQATVQMTEQMKQMMQVQIQWMQQMQQMMAAGMQGMPPGQQPPFMMPPQQHHTITNTEMLAPPSQQQRPTSQGVPTGLGVPGPQQSQQRTMSMMGPNSALPWQVRGNNRMSQAPSMMSGALNGPGPGYAPSMAPSERSNVGIPSRYRPVSIAASDEHAPRATSRSSTFTIGMLQPGGSGRESRLSSSGDRQSKLSPKLVDQTTLKKSVGSDDDDEEGWEEMKKKREKKKSTWRLRKRGDENGVLETYDYPEAQ